MAKSAKQQVLAAVTAYQRTTRHLGALLKDVDSGLEAFVSLIEVDEPVASLLVGTGAASSGQEFAETIADFEETRRRLRVALLRLGVEGGESVADMATALGISRQLAYRHLAEDRWRPGREGVPEKPCRGVQGFSGTRRVAEVVASPP